MPRFEPCVNLTAPGFTQRDKFYRACAGAHIPEIGLATFKFRLRPGEPEAVMMQMFWRIVIRDDATRWRIDRMDIAAAAKDWLDVRARQFAFGLIAQHLSPGRFDSEFVARARQFYATRRRAGLGFQSFQAKAFRGLGLQLRQHKSGLPRGVYLQSERAA